MLPALALCNEQAAAALCATIDDSGISEFMSGDVELSPAVQPLIVGALREAQNRALGAAIAEVEALAGQLGENAALSPSDVIGALFKLLDRRPI